MRRLFLKLFLPDAALAHGDEISVGKHQMIHQLDMYQLEAVPQLQGGFHILRGGDRRTAGMVVCQQDAGGIVGQSPCHQVAHIDLSYVDAAFVHQLDAQAEAVGVHKGGIDHFFPPAQEPGLEQGAGRVGTARKGPLALPRAVYPAQIGHQLQQRSGVLPHAGYFQQTLIRGVHHALQTAKGVDQPMGQLVGVLPGNGVKQQQFQHLMGLEPLQPLGQKTADHPLAVTVMDAHALPFFLILWRYVMKRILICLPLLLLALLCPVQAAEAQLRGVWVSTVYNLDYPSQKGLSAQALAREADAIIENAKSWGLNAVFLQVRPCGDALYPSESQPWSAVLSGEQGQAPDADFDPLAYFTERCHQQGLQLHAWLNPYRLTRQAASSREQALALLHPDHPARALEDALVFHTDGCLYLDPGRPEVRLHLLEVTEEILQNYPVDGIHLDDYFYPGADFEDQSTYARYGGDFADVGDFRRDAVNQLVSGLHSLCAGYDRVFGISPAGIWANQERQPMGAATTGSQSYYDHYADSRRWVREGMVDYIAPQIYWEMGAAAGDFSLLLDWWSDTVAGTDVDLYIGLAAYKSAQAEAGSVWYGPDELQRQLAAIEQSQNAAGYLLFRYRSLTGTAFAQALAEQPRPAPVYPTRHWHRQTTLVGTGSNQSVLSGQALPLECTAPPGSRVTVQYGTGWQQLKPDLCGGYRGTLSAESPYQDESYTAPALIGIEKHGMLFVQLSPFTVTSVKASETVSIEEISWEDTEDGHKVTLFTGSPAAASISYAGDVLELTVSPCRLAVLFRDPLFDHMEVVQQEDRSRYRLVFPDDGQTYAFALDWTPESITLTIRKTVPEPGAPGR